MSIETKKSPQITGDTYKTAIAGTICGTMGTNLAINSHYKKIAKKAISYIGSDNDAKDVFLQKHNKLICQAVESNKGFFGKINAILKGKKDMDSIKDATGKIIDSYKKTALNTFKHKYFGETLEEKTIELRNKLLLKDLFKSIKKSQGTKNFLIISAGAIIGLFGACIAKEIADSKKSKH